MTTAATTPSLSPERTVPQPRALSSLQFDWLMAAFGLWLMAGLYLDGWAHNHNPNLETFFTPWHGVLYSGFLIQAGVLAGLFVRNLRRGHSFTTALPQGYGLSLIGAAIFTVGGVGDMFWHIIFGIEIGVEALLSPTHLILAVGGILLITGPLRSGLLRNDSSPSPLAHLPLVISATLLYMIIMFFTIYANPYASTWISTYDRPTSGYVYITQAIGITSFLFQSALLSAIVLILLRNNKLRPGDLTLTISPTVALTVTMNDLFLATDPRLLFLGALAAALLSDLLLWLLKPSIANILNLRLFIAAVPTLLFGSYFIVLFATVGVWWSVHFWTGAILLCGAIGWLMSYLVIPAHVEKVTVIPN